MVNALAAAVERCYVPLTLNSAAVNTKNFRRKTAPIDATIVIPANPGIQAERGGVTVKNLDSRVRGNDVTTCINQWEDLITVSLERSATYER